MPRTVRRWAFCSVMLACTWQPVAQAGETRAAVAVNRFAFDLYAELASTKGNLFFSPLSVASALSMTMAGARGTTLEQMARTLGYDSAGEVDHDASGGLQRKLMAPRSEKIELNSANRLYADDTLALAHDFTQLTRKVYAASVGRVGFARAPEAARKAINGWVSDETRGRIPSLIDSAAAIAGSRLVLVNAVYFDGEWEERFSSEATRDLTFHAPKGAEPRKFMASDASLGWLETESFTAIRKAYGGGTMVLEVYLPKTRGALAAASSELTAQRDSGQWRRFAVLPVALKLPKFKLSWSGSLGDTLQEMGMPLAFSDAADFSAIARTERLKIDAVEHKAFVEVDERGTEAAAATGVVMRRATTVRPARDPRQFVADHPFVFLIRDMKSGVIAFMGRIEDPRLD
ncbi:MAG: serpin family protein [Pseudomonadota bacterium]